MDSGWESHLSDPHHCVNLNTAGFQHCLGFHLDAAALLGEDRDIVGIGVEPLSQDSGASADLLTHVTIIGAGRLGVETVANVAAVPSAGTYVVVACPKHRRAAGAPMRALAFFLGATKGTRDEETVPLRSPRPPILGHASQATPADVRRP